MSFNIARFCRGERVVCQHITALLVVFLSASAFAESPLSLQAAIEKMLAQNPALQVFEFRNRAVEGRVATASLTPAYEAGVELDNVLGSGDFHGVDAGELTVSLSSVLEMGDKRSARVAVATRHFNVVKAQQQVQALELLGELTRRYVAVLAGQYRVVLSAEASQLAHETLREVSKRVTAGAVPKAELKRAEATAAQSRIISSSAQQQLNVAKVSLAIMWGDLTPDFDRVVGNLYQFGKTASFDNLLAKVVSNPALRIFASEQRLKAAELNLANTQQQADIHWSVGLRYLKITDDSAIVAGFSLPLFAAERHSGAIKSASATKNEWALAQQVTLLRLQSQLYNAYHNRQQAILTVTNFQQHIIPMLEQALSETRQAYLYGRYSYLEYVDARQVCTSHFN